MALSDSAKSLPRISGIPSVRRKWASATPELRCRNILNSRDRAPRNTEHLSPAVVRRINRGYACVDYARQCADLICESFAKACDRARVRISNARKVEMTFEQVILSDSQSLMLQPNHALNQESRTD